MNIDQEVTQHLSDATSEIDGLTFISYIRAACTTVTTSRPGYKPDEGQKNRRQKLLEHPHLTLNLFMSQDYVYKADIR